MKCASAALCNNPTPYPLELLGVFCEVLTREIERAVSRVVGGKGETAAAVITIGSRPGLSIGELATILKLTTAGTSRVIDRLQAGGLAKRKASPQSARHVLVELTDKGHAKRRLALAERKRLVRWATSALTYDEIAVLERLFATAMLGNDPEENHTRHLRACRMCDQDTCASPVCPFKLAAQARRSIEGRA